MQPIARRDLLKVGGTIGLGVAAAAGLPACSSSGGSASSGGAGKGRTGKLSAQIPMVEATALMNESAFRRGAIGVHPRESPQPAQPHDRSD